MGSATPHAIDGRGAILTEPSRLSFRRLVVMSNRAPLRVVRGEDGKERTEPTVGGVGTTFLRLLEHYGGIWIAWSGSKKAMARMPMPPENPRFFIVFQSLTERAISNYYWGMCNRGLWPLMHFMPLNCHFDATNWTYYKRVNRAFAELANAEILPDDVVWVQDFHLALTPSLLRQARPTQPIGLFWHVPFPPEQLFRIFPWREELVNGMLGADLIGFHSRASVKHFLDCCERIATVKVDRDRGVALVGSREVGVGAFPIGIPTDFFEQMATSAGVRQRARRIRAALGNQVIVLGVDRLDYTKGLLERLLGFERFLEANPQYRRRVTLVQIAVPSRTKVGDYIRLKRDLDELVGHIVGRFSSEGWVPIRYLYTQFGAEELIAYYRAADIALITPLRDGMNLVAKEFVASRVSDDGVLILSEFAGASEELTEALVVNPYDIDQIADRLKRALEMDGAEKAARMRALRVKVRKHNLERWSDNFLSALGSMRPIGEQDRVRTAAG